MSDLLLELFSEEIPARMQARAISELQQRVTEGLKEARLTFKTVQSFVTPRRLALLITGLPKSQPDMLEERKGPKVGAPEKAVAGFANSVGMKPEELETRTLGKAEYYFAVMEKQGAPTEEALKPLLEQAIGKLGWPKSMRWGDRSLHWVRPLHSILCLLDTHVIPLEFAHLTAGNLTHGHRFLSSDPIEIKQSSAYEEMLELHYVIADPVKRRQMIYDNARDLAEDNGLELKEDEALLDEVTGLVEWPVVLLGGFDEAFMDVPPEVLMTAMRNHQKYFSLLSGSGKLAPHFIVVANIQGSDGGAHIIVGNERVLKARLADGKFFWDQDRKTSLSEHAEGLKDVIFHAKLGSIAEKTSRMRELAKTLAVWVPNAGLVEVERAAELAKTDLVTEMVGEFPELQGIMGRYYALEEGESGDVANAIRDHYAPAGPNDACPREPVSITTALADKIDSLTGLFAIGEKPTGSKDPFALRRAALGVIRLILENRLRIPLRILFDKALARYPKGLLKESNRKKEEVVDDLLAFFGDRLKVVLKEKGARHDLIAAVFALGEDDITRLIDRVYALERFLNSEDGANLLTAYDRAVSIVRIEEKKDKTEYQGTPDKKLLKEKEEEQLFAALEEARPLVQTALKEEKYQEAMQALAGLRTPVDTFFDKVTVNTDDASLRKNRLLLLSQIRDSLDQVADFSIIEIKQSGEKTGQGTTSNAA